MIFFVNAGNGQNYNFNRIINVPVLTEIKLEKIELIKFKIRCTF